MSDKISDETLQLIASDYMDACSLIDISHLMAKELIARRAAEVKPVKMPRRHGIASLVDIEKDDDGSILLYDDVIEAIKAAGATIEGE